MPRSPIDDSTLATLSEMVGLELSAERRTALAPALDEVLQQLDVLDTVDVGETPPAHVFDPRWKEQS